MKTVCNEKMQLMQRCSFPQNRFFGLRFSQRLAASFGVKVDYADFVSDILYLQQRKFSSDLFKAILTGLYLLPIKKPVLEIQNRLVSVKLLLLNLLQEKETHYVWLNLKKISQFGTFGTWDKCPG